MVFSRCFSGRGSSLAISIDKRLTPRFSLLWLPGFAGFVFGILTGQKYVLTSSSRESFLGASYWLIGDREQTT